MNTHSTSAVQHLMDRIAISLGADVPIDMEQRVAAMDSAKRFQVSPWRGSDLA